jgi:hypothetical protein
MYLGAVNNSNSGTFYSTKQCAFASIGDGLTDTEAANYYTAVQTFQTTLGRSIGTQTVSDADAQAFVTNAGIVDQVEANAINNLVIGMKADGVWTKMKAIYPFVGGTASQHKFNLKDPRDLDAAFRLVFNGGWTHSSTGATPNGTNGFADTKLNSSTSLLLNNAHISIYSRTNNGDTRISIGTEYNGEQRFVIWPRLTSNTYFPNNSNLPSAIPNSDSRGLFINNRVSSTGTRGMIRGTQYNQTIASSASYVNLPFYIGRPSVTSSFFDNREYAFSSIGDGLSDAELANLNTRVTTFQTALSRNV